MRQIAIPSPYAVAVSEFVASVAAVVAQPVAAAAAAAAVSVAVDADTGAIMLAAEQTNQGTEQPPEPEAALAAAGWQAGEG